MMCVAILSQIGQDARLYDCPSLQLRLAQHYSTTMRTFTIIWLGQLVSTTGSYITAFAFTLWIWESAQSATALALVGFFTQVPSMLLSIVAGVWVDRFPRKQLIILGDGVAAVITVLIALVYHTGHLEIWHLYLAAIAHGGFGQLQQLAYQASLSSLVPPLQLTRANSMNAMVHYGSVIVGPALAGILYPQVGLLGVLFIDLVTFAVAIATLLPAPLPQPQRPQLFPHGPFMTQLTVGFRTIWQQPGLRSLLGIGACFWFFHDLGNAIYDPMILARSGGSAQVLAQTGIAAGAGGVIGAIALSLWGGPKQTVQGMLAGFMGAGISKTVFGLGRSPWVWLPAQFCSSLNFPLLGSSETALWMKTIPPALQGRVFAANSLVGQGVSALAALVAGPLADRLFEPLMQMGTPSGQLFWGLLPSLMGPGSGMTLLYVLSSLGLVGVGLWGYGLVSLRSLPTSVQNSDPSSQR